MSKGPGLGLTHVITFALAVFLGGLLVGYTFGLSRGLRLFATGTVECP